MENKKNNVIWIIVVLILGFVIGIFYNTNFDGTHMRDNEVRGGKYMTNSNMSNSMDGMIRGLEGKTGDAFDKEFLAEMIIHHKGAVEMAKIVLTTSKRPELIKLANDIISAQIKEIEIMQEWQKTWFK